MKKPIFILALITVSVVATGQIYLYQGFGSGYWPPSGWTTLPPTAWSMSQTNHAGGISPEAHLQTFDYNGTVRLMTPYINTTGADTAVLSFRYFDEIGEGEAPVIGAAARSGSGNWNIIWEAELTQLIDPRQFEILIAGNGFGNADFQLSFFLEGDMNNLFNFYLDDVELYYPDQADGKLDLIMTPYFVDMPEPVVLQIINIGNTTINSLGLAYETTLGFVHDTVFPNLNVQFCQRDTFQFNRWWTSPFGDYVLKAWITSVNGQEDPFHPNDTLRKVIAYNRLYPPRLPCFESFLSSPFADCAWFDHCFASWRGNHPNNTAIDYTMSWNNYIDLYFIPDDQVRMDYYNLSYVPRTFCNGVYTTNIDTLEIQASYDMARKLKSPVEILSSYSMIGDSIIINTSFFPHESISGTRIQTVVIEKTTTGNSGEIGTLMHNTVMKMFPDGGYGDLHDLYNGIPYNQYFTANLSDTHIEDFSDLEVVIFVQQDSNREILQSAYAVKDAVYNTEDRLSMITLNNVPMEGFSPDVFTYYVSIPQGTVEPPVVNATPMYANGFVLIGQTLDIPGYAILDSYPESISSSKRYIIYFNYTTSVENLDLPSIRIYPNPVVNGKLFVEGCKEVSFRLYSIDGKLIMRSDKWNGDFIDVSGVQDGIYVLNLVDGNGRVENKKIVIW
jgi:hypothetical protein